MMRKSACCSALIVATFTIALFGCSSRPEQVSVSGPINLAANQRTVIRSPQPLMTANYWTSVCLLPAAPTRLVTLPKYGLVGPDGQEAMPKVTAKSPEGIEDSLPIHGNYKTAEGWWLCFQPLPDPEKRHPLYSEIIIVVPAAVSLKSITWHSVNK